MNQFSAPQPAEPFFLNAEQGKRFCLYHAPNAHVEFQGAFLYVHPFGDEMNKARRAVALQARAFAAMGFGVLQMDLFGCGDSSGEFVDARWDIWKRDLSAAIKWLENHAGTRINLWGLRLGALLALDFAHDNESPIDRIFLWQPVLSGELFLTQFLRLRLANEMLADTAGKNSGVSTLRKSLAAGNVLEIAGYEIAPALAAAIDQLDALSLAPAKSPVHWFEILPETGRDMAPPRAKVVEMWKQEGVRIQMHPVSGLPFWATQEITECPELLAATARVFAPVQS